MKKDVLFKTNEREIVAVYLHDELLYTKTYIFDEEGSAIKTITVYFSGNVEIQDFEKEGDTIFSPKVTRA